MWIVPAVVSSATTGLAASADALKASVAAKARVRNSMRQGSVKEESSAAGGGQQLARELELGRDRAIGLVERCDALVLRHRESRVDVAEVLVRNRIIRRGGDGELEL